MRIRLNKSQCVAATIVTIASMLTLSLFLANLNMLDRKAENLLSEIHSVAMQGGVVAGMPDGMPSPTPLEMGIELLKRRLLLIQQLRQANEAPPEPPKNSSIRRRIFLNPDQSSYELPPLHRFTDDAASNASKEEDVGKNPYLRPLESINPNLRPPLLYNRGQKPSDLYLNDTQKATKDIDDNDFLGTGYSDSTKSKK